MERTHEAPEVTAVAMCHCSNEQLEAGRYCEQHDCPNRPDDGDTYTVSLQAEHESSEGVFEDVILGTYPDGRRAWAAARAHVKANHESTAQVIAALPHSPEFTQWDALKGFAYIDDDFGGLTTERF